MRFVTMAHWDTTKLKSEEAGMSLLLTCFVIVLLGTGTMIFTADTQRLVIDPIENMMKRVTEISNDPLSVGSGVMSTDATQEGMETTFLLQTIDKIGNLMRIGFGEAGAQIIAANLRDSSDDQLNIDNILSSGRGIVAIFGFCDIRNFTDTTECLQEEVMTFVNRVAFVLHNVVKDCKGAANKNIGDAFLLSWKVPSESCDLKTGKILPGANCSDLFDNALYAFLRFSVLLRRHDEFVTSFSNEANRRLFQRMPDYRCAVGMGLHVGVAVEGAIGTHQKIDATYISSHVNNAEFLESSTKAYKVPLLMSHFFRNQLSSEAQTWCRRLDTVSVTDSLRFELWTYDIDYDADYSSSATTTSRKEESPAQPPPTGDALMEPEEKQSGKRSRRTIVLSLEDFDKKPRTLLGDLGSKRQAKVPTIVTFPVLDAVTTRKGQYSLDVWESDPDLRTLRGKMAHPGLMETWSAASDFYHSGAWKSCNEQLKAFQEAFTSANGGSRDGPADFLMKRICSFSPDGPIEDDPGHCSFGRVPRI